MPCGFAERHGNADTLPGHGEAGRCDHPHGRGARTVPRRDIHVAGEHVNAAQRRGAGRHGNVLGDHHRSPNGRHGVLSANLDDLARPHPLSRHADGDLARAEVHRGPAGLLRDHQLRQLAHGDQGFLIEEEPGQGALGRADAVLEEDFVLESERQRSGLGARYGDLTRQARDHARDGGGGRIHRPEQGKQHGSEDLPGQSASHESSSTAGSGHDGEGGLGSRPIF